MTDDGKPKSYEDLPSIAEEAIAAIRAIKTSSQGTLDGEVTADKEIDNRNSVGDVFVANQISNQLGCVAITKLVVISVSFEKGSKPQRLSQKKMETWGKNWKIFFNKE